MKSIVRSLIILLFPLTAFSQKEYFIYVQSEAEQPFFVRLADKTFTASPAGYLILSQLKDTTHTIIVGFPGNKWPDQRFSVAIRSKDHGYLLKNFGEKGWGLFNLQSMEVQMAAGSPALNKKNESGNTSVSLFTEILSKAANDPSLREAPVFAVVNESPPAATTQKKADPVVTNNRVEETPKKDTPANNASLATGQEVTREPVSENPLQVKPDSTIEKANEVAENAVSNSDVAAVKKAPVDNVVERKEEKPLDTVQQVVTSKIDTTSVAKAGVVTQNDLAQKTEADPEKNEAVPANPVVQVASKDYDWSEVVRKSERSTTDGFGLTFIDKIGDFRQDTIEIFIPNPKSILTANRKAPGDDKKFLDIREGDGVKAVTKKADVAGCSQVASDDDFFRLRKKMAGEKESEAMINEARKEFKTKCYTVDQVRNLGNLFLNEAGKFQFYEAAYANSTDKAGFVTLESELKDPYFVHRFKNLVK